jgi:4-hydroxy-2-oxoheptanedioate aldolase
LLKEKLKNGKYVLGTWCDIPSPTVINIIAKAGLDFVIVDMEHGPMDFKIAQEMVMSAECEGCSGLVRVPKKDESDILRALDIGASGIVVPHIESIDDRKDTVNYSKFSPIGVRGFNPYVRAGAYHSGDPEYCEKQNKDTLVAIILEGINALKDLENIVDCPEVDIVYIGTYDLSVALGCPGEVNNINVLRALEEAVSKIIKLGKVAGCMIHNDSDLKRFKDLGIHFITYKVDTSIVYDSYHKMKQELEKID